MTDFKDTPRIWERFNSNYGDKEEAKALTISSLFAFYNKGNVAFKNIEHTATYLKSIAFAFALGQTQREQNNAEIEDTPNGILEGIIGSDFLGEQKR